MVTVRNRELGVITVHSVTYSPWENLTMISFTAEAGRLIAYLYDSGEFRIHDPDYPKLEYRHEAFRPLIEEALSRWPEVVPA